MSGASLRPLGPADRLDELTELIHRAYAPLAEEGFRFWASHQSVDDTRRRIDGAECVVAEVDGSLAGTITLRAPTAAGGAPWYDRQDVASFGQYAVEPALQGRGIGSALLGWAETRARELGARELALDTAEGAAHLIAMYQRKGYRFVEHVDWRPHVNYRSVILSKTL